MWQYFWNPITRHKYIKMYKVFRLPAGSRNYCCHVIVCVEVSITIVVGLTDM